MIIPEYEHHRPETVEEACSLLASLEGRVALLAGGTEIVVDLKMGLKRFDHLVSLGGIGALRNIEMDGDDLVIGAMATAGMIARSRLVREKFPEITEVTDVFAARQVGNRATVGGNIAAAVPSADFPPILIALGSRVEIAGAGAARSVALENVFAGPRLNVLEKGEMITAVRLPPKSRGTGAKYVKFGLRDSQACCVAGAAAMVRLEGETCRAGRIVLGAVSPVPLLVEGVKEYLVGRKIDEEVIVKVGELARAASSPITDIRGTKDFRRRIVGTLACRALRAAVERARAGTI